MSRTVRLVSSGKSQARCQPHKAERDDSAKRWRVHQVQYAARGAIEPCFPAPAQFVKAAAAASQPELRPQRLETPAVASDSRSVIAIKRIHSGG
jgi:hypothetical protein